MRTLFLGVAALCGVAFVLTATVADPLAKSEPDTVITVGQMCGGCEVSAWRSNRRP